MGVIPIQAWLGRGPRATLIWPRAFDLIKAFHHVRRQVWAWNPFRLSLSLFHFWVNTGGFEVVLDVKFGLLS